jgi:putative peptidoglycan lipid II flippase
LSSAQFPDVPTPDPQPEVPRPAGFARASALLASGTLVSRALGFVSVVLLANTLGTESAAANAFTIANQLPNNVYLIVAAGVLTAVIVPQLVRARMDKDGGDKFTNTVITLGVVVFLAIALIATLCAPLLVHLYAAQQSGGSGRGFSQSDVALATAFAYWCIPQVFFYAIFSLLGEVLNARNVYGPISWAPVINNVVVIAGLLLFNLLFATVHSNPALLQSSSWTTGMISVLAGSATIGVAGQGLFLLLFWRRVGVRFRPSFRWRGVGLGRVGKAAGWTFSMLLITQLAGIVQSVVASLAGSQNPANTVLKNAWLIMMLPHGLIMLPIMTPYFTRMSGHAQRGDLAAMRVDLVASMRSVGIFVSLAGVGLIVMAYPFSAVFSPHSFAETQGMATVLIIYLIGLLPSAFLFIYQRTFYALEDTRTPFLFQALQSVLFVVGAFGAAQLARPDIAFALAAVITVACYIQTFVAAALLKRRIGDLGTGTVLRAYLVYHLALIPAAAAGVGVDFALGAFSGGFAVSSVPTAVVSLVTVGIVMAIIYVAVLALLRSPDLRAVAEPVLRRIRRSR